MVSVSTYDKPFLRHIVSYMTCFVKWSNLDGSTPNLIQWVAKANYVVIGGHNVDVMAVFITALLRFQAIIS